MLTENGTVTEGAAEAAPVVFAQQAAATAFDRPGVAARNGKPKAAPWGLFSALRGGFYVFRRDDSAGLAVDVRQPGAENVRLSVWNEAPNDRTLAQKLENGGLWKKADELTTHAGAAFASLPPVIVPSATLAAALDYLSAGATRDTNRPALAGLHLDGASWAASDGHRAHYVAGAPVIPATVNGAPVESAFSFPVLAAALVLRAITATKAQTVEVRRNGAGVCFWVAGPSLAVTVSAATGDANGQLWSILESTKKADYARRPAIVENGAALAAWLTRGGAPVWLDRQGVRTVRLSIDENGAATLMPKEGARVTVPGFAAEPGDGDIMACVCVDYLADVLGPVDGAVAVCFGLQRAGAWTVAPVEVSAQRSTAGVFFSALVMPIKA